MRAISYLPNLQTELHLKAVHNETFQEPPEITIALAVRGKRKAFETYVDLSQ